MIMNNSEITKYVPFIVHRICYAADVHFINKIIFKVTMSHFTSNVIHRLFTYMTQIWICHFVEIIKSFDRNHDKNVIRKDHNTMFIVEGR